MGFKLRYQTSSRYRVMQNSKQCCRSADRGHFFNVSPTKIFFVLAQTSQQRAEEERAGFLSSFDIQCGIVGNSPVTL